MKIHSGEFLCVRITNMTIENDYCVSSGQSVDFCWKFNSVYRVWNYFLGFAGFRNMKKNCRSFIFNYFRHLILNKVRAYNHLGRNINIRSIKNQWVFLVKHQETHQWKFSWWQQKRYIGMRIKNNLFNHAVNQVQQN